MEKRLRDRPVCIEDLPEEILGDILTRLETKEAIKTCIVSQRWKNLWTLCRNLDLDFTKKKYKGKTKGVRRCIDYVLNKHRQNQVDHLRIAFQSSDGGNSDQNFEEWFKFANSKQVESLEIDVQAPVTGATDRPLSLWAPPNIAIALNVWDRLTSMGLKSVFLDDLHIDLLISKSPNLETLRLENVPIINLEFKNTIPKLKRLEIQDCAVLKSIKVISAPNLEYLKHVPLKDKYDNNGNFMRTNIRICFEHAPKLGDVYLGGPLCRYLICDLQKYAPHLQKLQLDTDVDCKNSQCNNESILPICLNNLKQLELRFTCTRKNNHDKSQMDKVIIINGCLSLERLTLKYEIKKIWTDAYDDDYYEDVIEGDDIDDYIVDHVSRRECLKEVEFVGWSGMKSEVRFIRYLIHSCPNLEDLELDCIPPHAMESSWRGQFSPVPKVRREILTALSASRELMLYFKLYYR